MSVSVGGTGKGASGTNKIPKLSELTFEKQMKFANKYSKNSPIKIPENAIIKAQSKTGYEQISYKWIEGGKKYEVRWHTRTPGAPKNQGNTYVVERTLPGNPNGQRKKKQILVGEDTWVSKHVWQQAIADRQKGKSTPQQNEILENGHWKAP
ncbi:hypothetical protein H1Z61_13305 [Bacillus aquiflavi]|uniref:Uncharacterized protein n=1 Tax=Bacillus aquiflavi TaxID=2672567 RepID=A0A6B3W3D7_9BACI|nr:hypothetical protein [Bacillus aquiflavi]MBA4538083.1 hypothetical protein [Bacillus aquiflavi]NEY82381.1 hypothetical protein [Bacillus aquiflavi]